MVGFDWLLWIPLGVFLAGTAVKWFGPKKWADRVRELEPTFELVWKGIEGLGFANQWDGKRKDQEFIDALVPFLRARGVPVTQRLIDEARRYASLRSAAAKVGAEAIAAEAQKKKAAGG